MEIATLAMLLASSIFLVSCDKARVSQLATEPATWATQLSAATAAAQDIDKDALLVRVTAFPPLESNLSWSYTQTLTVEFDFVTASGTEIIVTLLDAAPASTLKVRQSTNPQFESAYKEKLSDRATYLRGLEAVVISPREAVKCSWDEARAVAAERNLNIRPLVGLNLFAAPVNWAVQYQDARKAISLETAGHEFMLTVDASNGAVLKRDLEPFYPFGSRTLTPLQISEEDSSR